jgi:hypothetical protein
MNYIDSYKQRKEAAIEYTNVLGRTVKPCDIRIKNDIVSCMNLNEEESNILLNYLHDKYTSMGLKFKDNDEMFEAEIDSMLAVKH